MKKFLTALLAILMVCTLAACGSKDTADTGTTDETPKEGTVSTSMHGMKNLKVSLKSTI